MKLHDTGAVEAIVADFKADRSRLLDIVEAVQRQWGQVSDDAVQVIAAGVRIHAVEVEDMLSFYAFFDRHKRGRVRIRLSKTPVSIIKGAQNVARAFEAALGIKMGRTPRMAGSPCNGRATSAWPIRNLPPWSTAWYSHRSHPGTCRPLWQPCGSRTLRTLIARRSRTLP